MTSGRAAEIERFLADNGWAEAARRPLADDASFRRYLRLEREGATAVLMDAPPPMEDVRPFLEVARLLRANGFTAPEPFAEDRDAGLVLLEDLGDRTFTKALAEGAREEELYRLAVDLLIELQRLVRPEPGRLPLYDEGRLMDEALLFVDWFLPAVLGRGTPSRTRESFVTAWRTVLWDSLAAPGTLVLRDFHVDNLMLVAGRPGLAGCGLLDFQDAVIGSPAYDLVSLLEDARRDVSADVVDTMKERYLAAFPDRDRTDFERAYAVLGAQRNTKIIGIFTRLMRRDGKPRYLGHIPRVWRLLEADLRHPALQPVRAWFEAEVPEAARRAPAEEAAARHG